MVGAILSWSEKAQLVIFHKSFSLNPNDLLAISNKNNTQSLIDYTLFLKLNINY